MTDSIMFGSIPAPKHILKPAYLPFSNSMCYVNSAALIIKHLPCLVRWAKTRQRPTWRCCKNQVSHGLQEDQ